jgi:hypothetical protein
VTDEGADSAAPTEEDVGALPARPSRALWRAIEPVSQDEFFARYWEREPLVVERGEAGRFADLLTPAEVERSISETAIRAPGFRLVKAGARLEQREYTTNLSWKPTPFTGTVEVDRVLEEWRNGATIVLQALHVNWPPLARYCRLLEAELGHPVQANAYYTPRSAQGFPVHHDTHDVFVLQVAGEKRWLLYEPVWELPLRGQPYADEAHGPPGEPEELVLEAGDTLYLPRGWLHEAATSESDSLHLTIGVNVYTWFDAVRAALDDCRDDVEFRRGVPVDGAMRADLVERLRRRLEPHEVAARMRERFVRTRRRIRDGAFDDLRALEQLDGETAVERRDTAIADVVERDGRIAIVFEGKEISFPARVREAVEFVTRGPATFRPTAVPGLDEEGQLAVVRRLVREGLLRVSGGAEETWRESAAAARAPASRR